MSSTENTISQKTSEKIRSIQSALREQKIDGWLFYDFWKRNEFAQRILDYPKHILNTRRFFYLIPCARRTEKIGSQYRTLESRSPAGRKNDLPELAVAGRRFEKDSFRDENGCHGIFSG